MKFKLKPTKSFEKNLIRLSFNEQKLVAKKLTLLMDNPFYPSLRTKKIQGFQGLFECSINMDIRLIWKYEGEDIILMLDIGHHSLIDNI